MTSAVASDLEALRDLCLQRFGRLDVVMNNVGVLAMGAPEALPLEAWERVLDLNLLSIARSNLVFLPHLIAQGRGHVVNTSSASGLLAYGFDRLPYVASKHAVVGLSEAVRAELRGTGIEVTVVMPGFAKTELAAGVPDLRGVPRIAPEDIAALTVDALKVPKFDVWAPKRLAGVIWTGAVVPRRMREAVSRFRT